MFVVGLDGNVVASIRCRQAVDGMQLWVALQVGEGKGREEGGEGVGVCVHSTHAYSR